MRKLTIVLSGLFLVTAGFLSACNKGKKEQSKARMYERSELAQLMADMWDENNRVKQAILNKDTQVSMADLHLGLTTSEPTDSADLIPVYYQMAGHYSTLVDSFHRADPAVRVKRYNAVVDGCVTCHQQFCTGPLPKIRQLYIPD